MELPTPPVLVAGGSLSALGPLLGLYGVFLQFADTCTSVRMEA